MFGALVTFLLATALPLPFSGADGPVDRGSWLTLVALAVSGATAAVALSRRRRLGYAVSVGAGLLAAVSLAAALARTVRGPAPAGPGATYAFVVAAAGLACFVLALTCCVSLREWRAVLR